MSRKIRARAEQLFERISLLAGDGRRDQTSLMEVCGTHTVAISRFGLRSRMPQRIRLISGPGCPVCVTPCEQIDQMIAMSAEPGVTVVTFGDMMRVPGSTSSLALERANGRDVRMVYSPFDALQAALGEPHRTFIFMGIGFETTISTVAATLIRAFELDVRNFFVLPAFKQVIPAMAALLADNESCIDGFICPGHVSAIIGSEPYDRLACGEKTPCVITGFEALDILKGIVMLLEQISQGRREVEVQYRRAVPEKGNPTALALMARVFRPCDSWWRGIGLIPDSGMDLAEAFSRFDARSRVPVESPPVPDLPAGCSCGEVIRGILVPPECPLFGKTCMPAHPVGPCMVSGEGACAAYFHYEQHMLA